MPTDDLIAALHAHDRWARGLTIQRAQSDGTFKDAARSVRSPSDGAATTIRLCAARQAFATDLGLTHLDVARELTRLRRDGRSVEDAVAELAASVDA